MAAIDFAGPVQRAILIKSVTGGSGWVLDPPEVAALASVARVIRYKKGEVLMVAGELAHRNYLIVSGAVDVSAEGKHVFTAGPSDSLGFLPSLAGFAHVDAVTLEETTALVIEVDAMLDVMEDHFAMYARFLARLNTMMLGVNRNRPDRFFANEEIRETRGPDFEFGLVERLAQLQNWSVWASASLDSIAFLAQSLIERRWSAGETIWTRGDASDGNLIIGVGRVKVVGDVVLTNDDGSETRTEQSWVVGEDFSLGSFDGFSGQPRWYDCYAETDVRGLLMDREVLLDVLEDDGSLARTMLEASASMVLESSIRHRQEANAAA